MNLKNIFKIHKLTYLFIIISILTASFHLLGFISFLLIIHEMGHFFTAKLFGVKVDCIEIYPYGGISKCNIPLNYSINKELIILVNGPLSQQLAYLLLITIFSQYESLIRIYHYAILIFNLLPIYPLDGGKLINLLFQKIIPYKKAFQLSIYISYLMVILIGLVYLKEPKINNIILVLFLLYNIGKEKSRKEFLYEKFLFERYQYPKNYKQSTIIKNKNNFYKNKRHLLKIGDNYALEADYLKEKYDKKQKNKKNR